LSTGTWIDATGMMKTFGIDLDSVEFVSIPTTFGVKKRPVYILHGNEYMDFAQKCDSGYFYKTPAGTVSFCKQVGDVAESVRRYYKENHNLKKNLKFKIKQVIPDEVFFFNSLEQSKNIINSKEFIRHFKKKKIDRSILYLF
jgi:hypothetical protein